MKYQKKGLCKALSMLLAAVMLLTSPIGITQTYALEDGQSAATDLQSELPFGAGEVLDSGAPLEESAVPAFTEDYPKLGTEQTEGSKKIEVLVKGILPEGETSMGLGYVLLAENDSKPTAEQIKSARGNIPGVTVITWGQQSLGDKETTITLTGEQDDTDYEFYAVCWKDDVFSEIRHLVVKTPIGSGGPGTPALAPPTALQWDNADDLGKTVTLEISSYVETGTRTSTATAEVSAAPTVLEVTTPEELEVALGSVSDGGTIALSRNINYHKGIVINAKSFHLDLGSYSLDVVNSTGVGIDIKNAILTVSGDGKLNAIGTKGVQAHNSKISVYSATGTAGAGVEASSSSYAGGAPCEVTVTTLAQGTTAGAYAMNDDCKIIAGSAKATAINGKAVHAEVGGTVVISGNVDALNGYGVYCVNGSATIGGSVTSKNTAIFLYERGSIVIDGNVNADKGSGTVVEIDGNGIPSNGTVTIGGTVSASDAVYVRFVNGVRTKNEGVPDGAYLKYMDSIDGEKAGIIRVKKVPAVCTIGAQEFTSLSEAITAAPDGETTTITLLQSITHNEPVEINGKSITFALGDFDLTIDASAISNSTALWVLGDGKVSCTGSGKLHVTGSDKGVRASGGSELHISGNVTARQYAVTAGSAPGTGTPKVTVDGDVTVTGQDVNAWSEVEAVSVGGYATVTIGGNVTANRTDAMQIVTAVYSNASTIVVGKNVTTQGSGVNAQNGGNVTIGGALHYNPTGSGDQAYIKVGDSVISKTVDDFEPTSIKPGYKEYRNGDNVVWIKEAPAICTIGAQKFTSLDAAIASVPAGGRATITMLQSITHTKHIMVEKKTINLDLMDYDLLLDTSANTSYSPALMVTDGGKVNLIGSGTGEFNIKSYMTAISVGGIDSKATVHNVVAGDGNGVRMVGSGDYLDSNSTVTVLGSIAVGNGNGVSVNAKDGKVVVGGNIVAGRVGVDIASNPGTQVTVNGDITVDGDSSIAGIWAYGATTVAVTGNVTVRGTNCVGVHASGSTIKVDGNVVSSGKGAHSDTNGKVEITGSLTAVTPFITVGTTDMTADQGTETGGGSLIYTDGANTVQIGSAGVSVPTYTITVQNDGHGTGSASLSSAEAGTEIILIATPSSGYVFKEWQVISGGVTITGNKFTMPANNVIVKAIFEKTSVQTYTVTVNGSHASTSGAGSYTKDATVNIYAGNLSNYTFTGWTSPDVTITVASSKNASFVMPGKAVTVTANWSYNGGGGGGSSDSSNPVIVTLPTPDKPNSPTQCEIKVPGTVDRNGNATVNISDKAVVNAYDKALADAKQNGITLVFRVGIGSKIASCVTVNLPKAVQDTIIAKKIVNVIIVVDNPDIRIGMDLATVQEINKQAKSDVNITATHIDSGKLTGDAKKVIGSRPVFDLKVNYGSGKQVQSFGSGSVSVAIPYTLGTNEKAGNVQAVYVDGKGRVYWIINSVYDSVGKVLRFATSHFSTYGIGYKQTNTAFTDIAGHWAKDDIEFVVSRGFFSGTSATTFSPNTAMTRGMFVTALGRLANADVSGYKQSSFTDVKSDAYYKGYIEWASKNSIVNGTGNGKFAPDQSITREQMAVIMQNYAKVIGFTLPKVHTENTFADSAKISAYAKDAVKQMRMASVISDKSGNLFDPQSAATRAEVSTVLRRFVEMAISSDTMQGWTRNDSGQWMHYENGKPVTGKKDIGGMTYTFDQYGVMADEPKNLGYTTYTVQKGDSFWLIAHKLGCTMSELERLNNKSRFTLIHPGDVLRVPEK